MQLKNTITKYGLLPMAMLSIGMLATTETQDSKKKHSLNNGNQTIQLMAPDWFINAPNSIYLNIDADNNSTDAVLEIAKDRRGDTGGVSLFKVQEDGKVGIGTTTPVAPLEVHNLSSGEILRLQSDRTYGYMRFREASTSRAILGFGDDGGLLVNAIPDSFAIDGMSTALHFAVDSDANKGITIDTDGHVGIGTTSPSQNHLMHIESATNGLYVTADYRAITGSVQSEDGTGVFGTADGIEGKGVSGVANGANGVAVSGYTNGANGTAVRGYSFSSWDFFAGGPAGHYGQASSIRWKSNVRNIDQPLEKIAQIRGVYFDWDEEHGGQHDVGMIAEEVGVVMPEIVKYEANGIDASGMDYSKLTPLLVEAVNALRAENKTQIAKRDRKIGALEVQNRELESRLSQIEAMMIQLLNTQTNEE